jgi:iron(III) transport system substrate-binding protein
MRSVLAFILVIALGVLAACGSGAASGAGASKPASGAPAASGAGAPGGQAAPATASALDALKAAAAKETGMQLYGASTFTKADADRLMTAFNQRYGLNVDYQYTMSGSMTRDTGRVIGEITAGSPPTWDFMMMTDAHYAMLYSNDVLEKVDWAALGITDPRSVAFDGTSIQFSSSFVAPGYNPNLVRPEDAPKDWNDILDPKWKGKVGVSTATHFWARLAQAWGDERTTRFVEGLAAQQPMLGNLPETYLRVTIGELAIFSAVPNAWWREARESGAAFVPVETVKPLIAQQTNAGLLKGVRTPNTAKLLAVFLVSPEGQALYEELQGQTSMFIDGTPNNRYVQGKEIVALDSKFGAEQLDQLTEKYGRMVGFR